MQNKKDDRVTLQRKVDKGTRQLLTALVTVADRIEIINFNGLINDMLAVYEKQYPDLFVTARKYTSIEKPMKIYDRRGNL